MIAVLLASATAQAQAPSLPAITTASPLPGATVGGSYARSLVASGGTSPYAWTLTGALPPGLSFSGGALTGTPTTAGSATFIVGVRDAAPRGDIPGPSLLEAEGSAIGPPTGWSSPKTDFAYRLTGTAVGKNNHNIAPGPPSGDPTGSPDPNLSSISYFRTPAGGTTTIDATFTSPLTWSNFSSEGEQFVAIGLVNQSWVSYSINTHGYSSRMFSTPTTGASGNAYLLVYRLGANVSVAMEDHEGGNSTAQDRRLVASIGSLSIQFQAGVDRNGNAVATGGRVRYALDGGAYGPWDDNAHDFVGQDATVQLGAFTFSGTVSAPFGSVLVSTSKTFDLVISPPPAVTTTSPLAPGSVSGPYSVALAASGGTTPFTWSVTSGALPPGLALASSGTLSGTPTGSGVFGFTAQMVDANGVSATRTLSLTINPAPAITTTSPLADATHGVPVTVTFAATGGTAPLTWSSIAGSIPPGLTLDAPGVLSGTPTAAGSYGFTIQVTDAAGATATKGFTITVRLAVTTSSPLPFGIVGESYSITLAATSGTVPYGWALSSGSVPSGLNLTGSGVLSGIPTAEGVASFTVQVTDAASNTGAKAFTLAIYAARPTIVTTSPLPGGRVGVAYVDSLAASGTPGPYTWSLAAGAPPPGITLGENGVLTGAPTRHGAYSFTVRVVDGNGVSSTKAFALTIDVPVTTIVTTSPLPDGHVGNAYSKTLEASAGVPPYQWTIASGTLPPGLAMDGAGAISGTPTTGGSYAFTVLLGDAAAARKLAGPSLIEAEGTSVGPPSGWSSPKTNYAYRLSGTAVGKNNHNLSPGPPSGDPSGSLDPNLATVSYFRMPSSGTVTIEGSFMTPLTTSNFGSEGEQFVTVGLVNQGWVDYTLTVDGYSSRMFSTPGTGANGNAYLLFYRLGSGVTVVMEDHEGGNSTATDPRTVSSVTAFSIQYQAGVGKNGSPVATGGRMRYALDGGAYGPWDDNRHDFVTQNTALQLGAFTFAGSVSATFGDVTVSTTRNFDLAIQTGALAADVSTAPSRTFLATGFPNPFTHSSTIRFGLRADGPVDLTVYDLFGRAVRSLVHGDERAGLRSVSWDGRGDAGAVLAPGLYLVRLRADGVTETRRLRLMR